MKSETLIVGIGSSHGDDQFGWRVAEQLAELSDNLSATVRLARSPAEIIGWLEGAERLMVCDACQDLGSPGRLHHWQWPDSKLSELRFSGSHDLGISAALGLADRLGWLPMDVSVWCAEGTCFNAGQTISPPVEAAVAKTVGRIQDELMRQSGTEFSYRG